MVFFMSESDNKGLDPIPDPDPQPAVKKCEYSLGECGEGKCAKYLIWLNFPPLHPVY